MLLQSTLEKLLKSLSIITTGNSVLLLLNLNLEIEGHPNVRATVTKYLNSQIEGHFIGSTISIYPPTIDRVATTFVSSLTLRSAIMYLPS